MAWYRRWMKGKRVWRGYCPNCLYIGEPHNCSCMWTINQVAMGRGADPDVIRNAKAIQRTDDPVKNAQAMGIRF
jgi:hypothetical protein